MHEVRQSVRSLILSPAFSLTAILTIALGIGANIAVYAVVHAVLLEPLPFRAPQQLVQIWESHPELHNVQVAVPDYWDWKNSIKTLDLAAYTFQAMNKGSLTGYGDPVAIQATNASSDLFSLLDMAEHGIDEFGNRAVCCRLGQCSCVGPQFRTRTCY